MNLKIRQLGKEYLPFLLPVAKTMRSFVRHQAAKRKIQNILKQRTEIFVEVGSGDKAGQNGWVTIDIGLPDHLNQITC